MAITSSCKNNSGNQCSYNKYIVEDGYVEECRKVVVHSFTMGDVEDVEIYAAEPLWKWKNSEQGQWVMKHSITEVEWHQQVDFATMGHKIYVTAVLSGPALTEWLLRYGK